MLVEKCDNCKKIISREKDKYIITSRMVEGRGSVYMERHFCKAKCLVEFLEKKDTVIRNKNLGR